MFRSARITLALAYTVAVACIMAAFSVALYVAISQAMSSNLDVQAATPGVEQAVLDAELARARLALLGVNVAGWVVVATASYLVAGRTLRPIEAAVAQQRQFTAHASHELRTPLTIMKGEIDVTRARERSPAQYRQTLDRIDAEVVYLDAMVTDLLALARLETGQSRPERQQGDLAAIIHQVIEPFRTRLDEREISLEIAVPPELDAQLDWTRIRLLLVNLAENAAQYTPHGGLIRISAALRGRYIDLSVFNSGGAIDTKELPHVFLPFYRGKGGNPDSGTGLGLALCEWIVRTHHGSIAARNVSGGVTFEVRLPRD